MTIPFIEQLEYILRIVCAVVCAGIIGLERERRVKSAGLKTHMIVSAGAAVMMIVSKYGFFDVLSTTSEVKLDPSRVAASIVSAVGFLGAGVIFTRGFKIKGVTTAAGLWATVGMGMAFGSGLYLIGAVTTALILIIQILFRRLRQGPLRQPVNVDLKATGNKQDMENLQKYLKQNGCHILRCSIVPLYEAQRMEMDLHFTMADVRYEYRLLELFESTDGAKIISIQVET